MNRNKHLRARSRSCRRPEINDLGIDFQLASESGVKICQAFLKPGRFSCKDGRKCPLLHAKHEKLYPSAGVALAKRVMNDPSLPAVLPQTQVPVSPLLGLTSFLLRNESPLVVESVTERRNHFFDKVPALQLSSGNRGNRSCTQSCCNHR